MQRTNISCLAASAAMFCLAVSSSAAGGDSIVPAAQFAGTTLAQAPNLPPQQGPATQFLPLRAAPASTEWSGQPGASGHPEMTVEAIQVAAANFKTCLEGLWPHAARRGISRGSFDTHAKGLTPELKIMDLIDAQPEFTKSVWDYLDILVNDDRIAKGRETLNTHRVIFDEVEKAYGIDRHVIAAIWGIESNFSTAIGERSVLRSTATLACVGRRKNYFRDEFLAALEILHRGDLRPEQLMGSWAGAVGPTQFMPTPFQRFAIDFDGDGRRDVVDSIPDLVASTANNLKQDGWASGQTWGYEVVVPRNFNFLLADRSRQMTLHEWERLGIRRASGAAFPRPNERAYLLIPAGSQGPGFLMLQNFRVIMKYNPAEAYALAIGHLADRIRGGGALVQPWPRHERVLTLAERYELQQLLAQRGFKVGEHDGRFGPITRAALRDFQAASGLVPDGFASSSVLARLRGQ
ncbi:MAG: lytic murein transglycosylase [Rhizobiales bacterium]|nr:lytic murein transglycosylase [Hyphomicrobiales bacterium]